MSEEAASSEREILTSLDVALLGRIAASAFDNGLLDESSPAVIDVARRCWLAEQEGLVLAVALTMRDVLGVSSGSTGGSDE